MAKTQNTSSGKRFGPRYGRKNRDKVAILEHQARRRYPCPECGYEKVKRQAAGIWECQKCGNKFASRAYTVAKPITLRTRSEEYDG